MPNKINYTGSSKVIKRICEAVNALIDGGGGGTTDYNDLSNKPSINNVALSGNKSASDLNLVSDSNYVHTDNNYTTTEKNKLAGLVNYTLPNASANTLGGVKVGSGLSIDNNGVLSATGGGGGGGSTVSITPTFLSGIKLADFTIDGVSGAIYNPGDIIVKVETKVTGGYNGGAVISILFDDVEKFSATGNSPYNLAYDDTYETFDYGGHTYEITITPPTNQSGDSSILGIEITDGTFTISYNVQHLGNNTSYGYSFDDTDTSTFKYSGGSGGSSGLTMWRVLFYNSNGTELLYREYVANGDDCIYGTDSQWSDESGGSAIAQITENISQNLSLYMVGTVVDAVHIYTKSTGGNDAAVYVQNGHYYNGVFTAEGDPVSVLYTTVRYSRYDCNGIATLGYPSSWNIIASGSVTDGTNTYESGDTIRSWDYYVSVDFYVYGI